MKNIFLIVFCILLGAIIIFEIVFVIVKHHAKSIVINSTPNNTAIKTNAPKVTNYQIPILMYHYIRDASTENELGQKLSVSPQIFDSQLKWINDNNYKTVNVSDIADPNLVKISKIINENKKPIILTFDDGYEDAYTSAYPIMKKYNDVGTFYIIRNDVGTPNYMGQNEINFLSNAGNEIGSHTLNHLDLSKINSNDAHHQIFDSKGLATSFCYPSGKFNEAVVSIVKTAGYVDAVTTNPGIANQNSNLFELPRVRVENVSAATLANQISKLSMK